MSQTIMPDIRRLAQETGFPRVTIHAPMNRKGREVRQNSVVLEKAATTAARALVKRGMPSREAEEFVRPAIEIANDDARMQHQQQSMSLFIGPEEYETMELPVQTPSTTFAGDRFSILELVPAAVDDRRFAILAISLGSVGLYECSRYSGELVDLDGLPEDLCYVLRYDDFEKSVQHHATSGGGGAAMHHGHGAGTADHATFVRRFIDEVEPRVTSYLAKQQLPLVLVGTEDAIGQYRARTTYAHVQDCHAVIDPHSLSLEGLLQHGWDCIVPSLEADRRAELELYNSNVDTVKGIYAVLPALAERRVETLFVNSTREIWGTFDAAHEDVHILPPEETNREASGENLINVATCLALSQHARVVPLSGELEQPAVILR